MNYEEFAQLPVSEKVVLCKAEARSLFKVWTWSGPYTWYREVPFFLKSLFNDLVPIEHVDDITFTGSLAKSVYHFDPKTMRVYVRMKDGEHPKTKNLIGTYSIFFSTAPQILPWDLANGEAVDWDGRVDAIGSLGQQLDDQNTGIVLESSSQVTFHNNDGYFDPIYDTLIWENQNIEFYSWSPRIPISQAYRLFAGVIESKSFAADKVTFKVKDFVYKLKNQVNLKTFTTDDGQISDSELGTPKRRIYGQVKQVKTVGIDKTLKGYPLTGTISVSLDSLDLTGVGTQFLKELSPQDEIMVTLDDGTEVKLSVDQVLSDTSVKLGDEANFNVSNLAATVKPNRPYRFKNRRWHIAGHKLRRPIATIQYPTTSRRFYVDSVEDFFADDLVVLNGADVAIRRISGNNIILKSSVFPMPVSGDQIVKNPVTKVYFGPTELLAGTDWTLLNNEEAIIEISPMAEFNRAKSKSSGVALTFTSGSREITTTATIDLRTIAQPRDWIKNSDLTKTQWMEILDVKEQSITVRETYTESTQTITGRIKNVELIDDTSLITVDCIGMEHDGKWMKTASDAVRNLVLSDAGFDEVDEEAFSQAKSDCPYILSLVVPQSIGQEAPKVRDVITLINESVFGSLYGNKSQKISYSILNSRKPADLQPIRDDDLHSWTSVTDQKIVNKVIVKYRPFIDIQNGNDAFESLEYQSQFVDVMSGIQNTSERTIYLFEEAKARIIAQRIAFFQSLSNCKLTLIGKLNLSGITVNDKMYLELDRLFQRYGGKDNKKIGIVTGVQKNGLDVEITMTDLGNIFNRIPSIAPSGTLAYAESSRDDAVKFGFILDNDTLTPNYLSETDLGNNRIG